MTELSDLPPAYRAQAEAKLARDDARWNAAVTKAGAQAPLSPALARKPAKGRRGSPTPAPEPVWAPGTLPLAFQTRIDPARVLLHVTKAGRPVPKGRPQVNHKTGNVFTPEATRRAEQEWQIVMRAARVMDGPSGRPVGVLAWFRIGDDLGTDVDNCLKTCLDSAIGVVILDDKQCHEIHAHILRRCPDEGTDLLIYETGRR